MAGTALWSLIHRLLETMVRLLKNPGNCSLMHNIVCEWIVWQAEQNSSQQFELITSTMTMRSEQGMFGFKDVVVLHLF